MLDVGRTLVITEQNFLKVKYVVSERLPPSPTPAASSIAAAAPSFSLHPNKCSVNYVAVWESLTLIQLALKVEENR